MLSPLNAQHQAFVYGLDQIQTKMQNAQQQLTSGLKLAEPSDDPSQVPILMQTRAELDSVDQISSNLDLVNSEVNGAQNSLQSAVKLFDQVQSLGTEAEPSSTSAETRQQIADQLGGILQQFVGIANTTVGGRYVFSGDSDQTAPYTIDLTQPNPISAYAGSASTRKIQIPNGSSIAVAETAQQVFDSSNPQDNVFQSVNTLRNALINNDQSGIDSALSNLKSAGTYLNTQLAFYGNVQNQISSAQNDATTQQTQLKTQLSTLQDADEASAIEELTQTQTEEQAALTSEAQMPRQSLFSYLG